ncbi:MAG: type II toxin-antitoxin system RelE/ParE family toxin [Thermodesulfobacteriota bacterium]|nr:type II toxin-antitoxin system RelE/ParE family toxin [Thermodesulfobacteriota bacterium]
MAPKPLKIRVPNHIAALIREMHPQLKRKVRGSLEAILREPHCGKALKEELSGLRSFRVSRFRIIYRIAKGDLIEVVALGPRERIYEETFRIISKENKNP